MFCVSSSSLLSSLSSSSQSIHSFIVIFKREHYILLFQKEFFPFDAPQPPVPLSSQHITQSCCSRWNGWKHSAVLLCKYLCIILYHWNHPIIATPSLLPPLSNNLHLHLLRFEHWIANSCRMDAFSPVHNCFSMQMCIQMWFSFNCCEMRSLKPL